MSNNFKTIIFGCLTLLLITLACNTPSLPPLPSSPTSATSAKISQEDWNLEWSLVTGSINSLSVAEDGTIYGLTKGDFARHITISSDGEIINTVDLTDKNVPEGCIGNPVGSIRPSRGGMGLDGSISCFGRGEIFVVRPNSQIYTFSPRDVLQEPFAGESRYVDYSPYILVSITDTTNGLYFMDLSGRTVHKVFFPEFSNYGSRYSNKSWYNFVVNEEQNQVVYYTNTESNAVYRGTPDGFDAERFQDEWRLTQWGDLYLYYTVYDSDGFETNRKIFRVKADGTTEYLVDDPFAKFDAPFEEFLYIEHLDKIYYVHDSVSAESFILVNRDLEILEEYELPFEKYGNNDWFIGADGALYLWNRVELRKLTYTPEINS